MKKSILFVCLGNICRSPSAEAVFKYVVDQKGASNLYSIDSAGTSGYHEGEPADARMQVHAKKRGYQLRSVSRKFTPDQDFDAFDMIIAMDAENSFNLQQMARNPHDLEKISLMTDFIKEPRYTEVPDPYYGGSQGFETVLDILEEASQGLYEHIKLDNK